MHIEVTSESISNFVCLQIYSVQQEKKTATVNSLYSLIAAFSKIHVIYSLTIPHGLLKIWKAGHMRLGDTDNKF